MAKSFSTSEYELPIVVTRDDDGFLATCPVWSDCYAQGDTVEEAAAEMLAVANSLVEIYSEEGKRIPLNLKRKEGQLTPLSFKLPLVISLN